MLQKPNASHHVIPYLSDAEMESMLSFIKNKLPVQEQEAKVIHDGKKKKKNLQIIYVETLRQSFVKLSWHSWNATLTRDNLAWYNMVRTRISHHPRRGVDVKSKPFQDPIIVAPGSSKPISGYRRENATFSRKDLPQMWQKEQCPEPLSRCLIQR